MADVTLIEKDDNEVEHFNVGPLQIRVLEDGRNTDNRLGAVTIIIPARTSGPPQHWHRMHDETFLITRGRVRFSVITTAHEAADHDTKTGDYVVVPPKSIHTFSNPFDEEAEMYNTFTPAYYVDYLRMLGDAMKKGKMDVDEQRRIMAQFATFPPDDVEV